MKRNRVFLLIATVIFAVFGSFWVYLWMNDLAGESSEAELFSATYGLMALYGGILGLFVSKKWGGFRSLVGKSLLMLSCGLLAQEFGQASYSMYTYLLGQEIPYPSLGDVGYFGSVIFYILAVVYLMRATNAKYRLVSMKNKLVAVVLPGALLAASYFEFLKEYEVDFSNKLVLFLDFGYPLGQAFYIALALLTFLLARKYLGGLMRPAILLILFALVVQYAADFMFLYQVSRETWVTAGNNELLYLTAYFVMTVAILRVGNIADKLGATADKPLVSAQEGASNG